MFAFMLQLFMQADKISFEWKSFLPGASDALEQPHQPLIKCSDCSTNWKSVDSLGKLAAVVRRPLVSN